ncbi:alpha/beta fold hydrolase [Thermotoga sp. KOL6]|uniref:alpha/beta fold hydrolase n=1 Tax=Thermotoga sp. KOL6 TaxID=126741 RepID=UPI000C77E2A1|nr:alpha/beta fold hydrolase [Thermotoga sp. KOL6]PLV59075.1 dipeptidyl aminopeptidase [Thermotoga sp. KOL6]
MKKLVLFFVFASVFLFASFDQQVFLFVQTLVSEKFDAALKMCTDQVKAQLTPESLSNIWNSLKTQFGSFKEVVSYEGTQKGEYEVYNVVLKFERGKISTLVTVDRNGKVAGLFFTQAPEEKYSPPEYVNTERFIEEDVMVGDLPGKITVPKGTGPFPAVVLIHGSGPNDMDETIGPNKIFKDIAYGLSSNGIIVLRYHKRTYVKPMDPSSLTVEEEVIKDAIKAVQILRKRKDVSKVFVLGHSLGAMLAPEIAERSHADGVVMISPPARPLEEVMEDQLKYLQSLGLAHDVEKNLEILEKLKKREVPPDEIVLGASARYFYDLEDRNPVSVAKEISIPMLLIFGERDYQVTKKDREIWSRELSEKQNVKIVVFKDLNHLMMSGKEQSTPIEYIKKGHVDENVIETIAKWMVK